jgi:hypothetical protein
MPRILQLVADEGEVWAKLEMTDADTPTYLYTKAEMDELIDQIRKQATKDVVADITVQLRKMFKGG